MSTIRLADLDIPAHLTENDETFAPTMTTYSNGSRFAPIAVPTPAIQLPSMTAPFGVSCMNAKWTLTLNVTDPAVAAKLGEIDAWAQRMIAANPLWTAGRPAVYSPLLKPPRGAYAPTLTLKLRFDDAANPLFAYADGPLVKGAYVRGSFVAIAEVTGIWMVTGRIGVTFRLEALKAVAATPKVAPVPQFLED